MASFAQLDYRAPTILSMPNSNSTQIPHRMLSDRCALYLGPYVPTCWGHRAYYGHDLPQVHLKD